MVLGSAVKRLCPWCSTIRLVVVQETARRAGDAGEMDRVPSARTSSPMVCGRSDAAAAAAAIRSGLRGDDEKLRREVHDYLTSAVLGLTGM